MGEGDGEDWIWKFGIEFTKGLGVNFERGVKIGSQIFSLSNRVTGGVIC